MTTPTSSPARGEAPAPVRAVSTPASRSADPPKCLRAGLRGNFSGRKIRRVGRRRVVQYGMGPTTESPAVGAFLDAVERRPSALVAVGEAGIGKTTLWLGALEQARERGFRVLAARAGQAESGLAYAVLADLLEDVDPDDLDTLPRLQRVAIDR